MLGLDSRSARAAWTIFLVALSLFVLYCIRRVLLVFVLAILFAYLLSPVVNLVDRFSSRRVSRTWALAAVYVVLIGLLILFGFLIGTQVSQEASNLATQFPDLVKKVEARLETPGPAWFEPVRGHLLNLLREGLQTLAKVAGPVLQTVIARVISILSGAIVVILVPILAFFFLKDGNELRSGILGMVGGYRRAMFEDIMADVHQLLGRFMRALVLLSVATLAAYSLFFTLLGVPYGVLLASIAAVLEFIPMAGPVAAIVIILLVALFSGFGHVLVILAILTGYRIFQDYILSPHLMSAGVTLHPLLVIFGALAGEEIAGIPGMFLSVPVLATLRVIYVRIQKTRAAAS
jgi:predicted PurR-regulated permease PerM